MERYPLNWPSGWPRSKKPVRSRFGTYNSKPSIAKSTDFISAELKRFGATEIIINTNLKYKNDGFPYSNQREPEDQGVAVYFKLNDQPMVLACDTFDKIGCNLYAIGRTIESLRRMERDGCSELMNRAFTGFKALPEESSAAEKPWWEVLGVPRNSSDEVIKSAYRKLVKIHHPDKGGNDSMFHLITKAYNRGLSFNAFFENR